VEDLLANGRKILEVQQLFFKR